MITLASLWRYPIKAHGCEAMNEATLTPDKTIPGDRVWAVTHEATKAKADEWSSCGNFTRGAGSPQLMAITSSYDDAAGAITLRHPTAGEITFDPDGDTQPFLDWVAPLVPGGRAQPQQVIRSGTRGMTDTPLPTISLIGEASRLALSKAAGRDLAQARFRANIWLEGTEAWEELDWVGKTLAIGDVRLLVVDRNTRCTATHANPATGVRDTETLSVLETTWGHKDLGVYAVVTIGGTIRPGDALSVV